MVNALELLRRAYAAGVTVRVIDGGRLQLRGRPCPDDLKSGLIASRSEVLAFLEQGGVGTPSSVPEVEGTINYVVVCRNCACPILGPCSAYLDTAICPLADISLQQKEAA